MSTSTLMSTPRPWPAVQALLPSLSQSERRALLNSIRESGVQQPILILPDGRIIDGHHRWELSDGKAAVEVRDLPEEEALALALALNIARRQMSPEQVKAVFEQFREGAELRKRTALQLRQQGLTQERVAATVGVGRKTVDDWESECGAKRSNGEPANPSVSKPRPSKSPPDYRVSIPRGEHNRIYARAQAGETYRAIAADYKVSERRIGQIVRIVEERERPSGPSESSEPPPVPRLRARCLVIDPPWPVEKIEREVRPNQGPTLDYPTMTETQILALGAEIAAAIDPSGCHVYLWVTHKYLPLGLRCFEAWAVRYQCLMTWVKNVGFTPFSWMYSTEHVLFGRVGSLDLLKLGMRLDFTAPVREHSRKPQIFYDLVRQASPGPRLDMFSRETHEGFDQWGNEVNRFVAV